MYRYQKVRISRDRTVDEHRVVAGVSRLGYGVVIHHIDGDAKNNDPANLRIMTRAEHTSLHRRAGDIGTPLFKPDENGQAVCRLCGQTLPWDSFETDRTWSHGKRSACKECKKKQRSKNG